jgi:flagellar assembly protein FliH
MAATKFIFERQFPDTPDRIVPLEPKEPTLTVSEHTRLLALAAASARTEGMALGRSEAEIEQTARLAEAMEQVSRQFDRLCAELETIHEMASEEAIVFAREFGRKLAGSLLDQAPMAAIEAAARSIFDDLRGQAHVAIRVAPNLIDAAREAMTAIAREKGFDGRLIVMGEPEIPPGDVRIEWADGGIVADRTAAETMIEASVERALANRMTDRAPNGAGAP